MISVSKVVAAALLALSPTVYALLNDGLTEAQINAVRQQMMDRSHVSWEYGTAIQAILEHDFTDLSPYGSAPFPPPYNLDPTTYPIALARRLIDIKPAYIKSIVEDGSSGDPMSIGIGVILANHSLPEDPRFQAAWYDQLGFIEWDVPQTGEGAISHRVNEVQLWSDSCFMVPPTLAYWGALQSNPEVAKEYLTKGYDQLRLYRDVLRDQNANNGLWHHVIYGSWSDPRHWTTGHGWAVAGILRVHQTIAKSAVRDELSWMLPNLAGWAQEIVGAVWQYQRADGSLYNYLDEDSSFVDMSGTALMAAVTYRLASIADVSHFIPNADRAFALVKSKISPQGILRDVVNPYDFTHPYSDISPEGNAFVLMLQAAYRDHSYFRNSVHTGLENVFGAFAKVIEAAKELEKSSD